MNVTPTGSPNVDPADKSPPPDYDQAVPSRLGLVRLVTRQLSHIKLHQGDIEEKLSVQELLERLISEYPGVATIGKPLYITQAQDESHKDFLKRFIHQVIYQYPRLKFQEVNSRDEAEQSGHDLTHFYDKDNRVDIKICKIAEVIESVKQLVSMQHYPWISKVMGESNNDPQSWGKHSGLLEKDFFIAAGLVVMGNLQHESVIQHLREANAITGYNPLVFFRNEDDLQKGMLIICTSTDPDHKRRMGISITSD
ncbi:MULTISPECIES: hypothetical protein [unclassified Endozoicomonas]|uniref:hypothetical protein n=1 Tax=unclassified Endozoicomonas TaxID=2644528 RepID=UPI003BB50B2E